MKRRNLLKFLILLPTLFIVGACKQKEFTRDTVIFGEVINQDKEPVEGFWIRFLGEESGLSGRTKFHSEVYTDSLGRFSFSQRIPKGTDHVILFLEGSDDPLEAENFELYQDIDGKYELILNHDLGIPREQWGKPVEIKLKKQGI